MAHLETKGLRDGIYLSLFPVAEWIVENWWALLYEVSSPHRPRGFLARHSLAAASEGFALPSLTIISEGPRIRVEWQAASRPGAHLSFVESGQEWIERDDVASGLSHLVTAVVSRLDESGIHGTHLQADWRAITQADREEREFCQAAGRLGLDPYAIKPEESDSILAAADRMPTDMLEELFSATDVGALVATSDCIKAFLDSSVGRSASLDNLTHLKKHLPQQYRPERPWDFGYATARELRKRLNLGNDAIPSVDALGQALQIPQSDWLDSISEIGLLSGVDVIVASSRDSSPFFGLRRYTPRAKTFAVSRGLFEYLHFEQSLVTRSQTYRQKMNRAFAAELLAPSEALRQLVQDTLVSQEEVEDIAERFGTSEAVIRHQLENHGIAQVCGL